MQIDWSKITWFAPEEFDDPNHPGSHTLMDARSIIALNQLREATGWGIITHNKHGLRGCVCVDKTGHSSKSLHYPPHCNAVDFHFDCTVDAREQAMRVLRSGFAGIGIYYDWHWNNDRLSVGFHVDLRKRPQVWTRKKGQYLYILE